MTDDFSINGIKKNLDTVTENIITAMVIEAFGIDTGNPDTANKLLAQAIDGLKSPEIVKANLVGASEKLMSAKKMLTDKNEGNRLGLLEEACAEVDDFKNSIFSQNGIVRLKTR